MSLEQTEQECAENAIAPRVTLKDIEDSIACKYELTAADAVTGKSPPLPVVPPLLLLSMCIVVLTNGFTVIGKSAPASAENFNAELGRKLAYEDAVRQIWPLMGFALRDRLQAKADAARNQDSASPKLD